MTKFAVAGSTGLIGSQLSDALRASGHDVVGLARSQGVDLASGEGLAEALAGAEVVIDVTNTPERDPDRARAFFETTTGNLLAEGQKVGVRHHVVLSIVGLDRVEGNAHYVGKRAQEQLVSSDPGPWTILRATQFFEFPEMVMGWTKHDDNATLAPLLIQPIASADVASTLMAVALDSPALDVLEAAGPETHDFVDMARRTLAARGDTTTRLVASWRDGPFSVEMAGEVLLPGPEARIAPTVFADWLAGLAAGR